MKMRVADRPACLSAALCVHYKSAASGDWHYTACVFRIDRRDGMEWTPDGGTSVPENNIIAKPVYSESKMT